MVTRSRLSIAQVSSSFKHFDMHHTTPILITEALHVVTYVDVLNNC